MRNGLGSDLDERDLIRVQQQLVPESKRLFTDVIKQRGKMPHALYVRLTEDRELDNHIQSKMITNLQPDNVINLPSGHLLMLSKADELARKH